MGLGTSTVCGRTGHFSNPAPKIRNPKLEIRNKRSSNPKGKPKSERERLEFSGI
jgi:hypothetical protein